MKKGLKPTMFLIGKKKNQNHHNFSVVLCCNLLGLDMFKCPKYDVSIS